MEKRITFYPPQTWRGRFLGTVLTLVALLLGATQAEAQRVHIGLDNGSLVNAVAPGEDTGWSSGFSTLWRHEQLSLSVTGTDRDEITESGEVGYPSTVFGRHTLNGEEKMTMVGGRRPSFIVVSLPKGYRITSYKMVLVNDLGAGVYGGNFANLNSNQEAYSSNGYGTMRFYETERWETDQTNAGTHGRDNGEGYNANQVRYIEPGSNWQTGNQIGSVIIKQALDENGNGNIRTNDKGANKKFTIQRTALQDSDGNWDMGNQLYFRLVKDYCFYGVTIESFEIEFTAEGTFEADVVPDAVGPATSVVKSPFLTSKIDIGELKHEVKDGVTYFAYNYENVKDLEAYNYLYQDDAVADGIPSDVAEKKNICPVEVDGKLLYALKSDTYFIETPTLITTQSGNEAPIGYRIVGALFTPLWGTETSGTTVEGGTYYYITYTSNGTTYYLNDQARFTTNKTTTWISDNTGVHAGNTYLVCSGNSNNNRSLSTGNSNTGQKVQLANNGRLYYSTYNRTFYLHGTTNAGETPTMSTDATTSSLAVWTEEEVQGYTTSSFTPGPYKLKIWKCDGSGIQNTIEISGLGDTDLSKPYDMGVCNNDAIKFEIEMTGDDADNHQALVQVTLLLQALDPYINKMDIVCTDDREVLKLTQSFTADDFSVSGGKFIFYVPEDYKDDMLTFTFSDLYSIYGDNTYYDGGSGSARYSFVTSPYFTTVNGNGNDGLYSSVYSPSTSYVDKVYTSTAGNIRFKFNNAEDLGVGGSEEDGSLEEYPFSVATYFASTDPGDPLSTPPSTADPNKNGAFIPVKLQASSADQHSGTYFVFTADETRWNIAPTKNMQHRFYAFYRMEIELRAKSFTPQLTWTQIYDETCYDEEGTDAEKSMWGVSLIATDSETGEIVPEGYLTYQEIINALESEIANDDITTPDNTDQILYVDGTNLYAMIKSSQSAEIIDLEDLKPLLSANNLVFLPVNTTSLVDNVAYKTATGSYQAGGNIVLTDKKPFFTPYTINVGSENYATYTREVTIPVNGQVTNATVILPFTLRLENGSHTNPDGKCTFTVNTMQSNQNMSTVEGSGVNYGTGYFDHSDEDVSIAMANVPYMINVTSIDESLISDGKISFVVTQKGSDIAATPKAGTAGQKEMEGETTTGSFGGTTYNFTNYGSYSGVKYDRADSEDIFYFAQNKYLNLHTLNANKRYLYSYPFRAVYKYDSSTTGAKMMRGFDIAYGENPFSGIPTDIAAKNAQADLIVKVGKGIVTMSASRAQDVNINSLSGMSMKRVDLNAGDTKTVNLPAGIYMINNVKVIVK